MTRTRLRHVYKRKTVSHSKRISVTKDKHLVAAMAVFVLVAGLGVHFLLQSHAATLAVSQEAENGTIAGNAVKVSDTNASGGSAVKFGTAGSSQDCTNPAYTTSAQFGTWNYASNILVNNNVWGPASGWSQTMKAWSPASWNVTAHFNADGGAIQTYPDTQFLVSGKTIAQYNSMQACFGETSPTDGEWDYGYDNWLNNFGIEVMVWNDWTDTGIYPPSNARAVTIDGVAYHTWKGGGSNEWIYTMDARPHSGCIDMLHVFQDLVVHPGSSGITSGSTPNAIEYGVEIASTASGNEVFTITNATLTTN